MHMLTSHFCISTDWCCTENTVSHKHLVETLGPRFAFSPRCIPEIS